MRRRMESGAALGWVLCAVTVLTAARANFVGPYKYTFASADPVGAQAFAEKYLGAVYVKQRGASGAQHPGSLDMPRPLLIPPHLTVTPTHKACAATITCHSVFRTRN